jgi:hypothetical protein
VIEYDIPDREGSGSAEVITWLSTILEPAHARVDEPAGAYHQRWDHETAQRDQLKLSGIANQVGPQLELREGGGACPACTPRRDRVMADLTLFQTRTITELCVDQCLGQRARQ